MADNHAGKQRPRTPSWLPAVAGESINEWLATFRVSRSTLSKDAVAGIPGAVGSVPDGMASGVLAGVNPVFGLYASIFGPIFGGLFSSSALMVVTTTSAAALAAGSTLGEIAPSKRESALFMLVILAGVLMTLAGIFRLGRYTRFVSQSVMLGFLSGVAINVMCSQLSDLTGIAVSGGQPINRAWQVITNLGDLQPKTFVLGLISIGCLVGIGRTKFKQVAALAAIVIPSLLNAVLSLSASLVSDNGEIPRGLPLPHLPRLSSLSPNLIVGAFAIAIIVLVQGVGVGETVRIQGRPRPDTNRDFLAQGVANVASGLFQGLAVGGSVGQSALNGAAGAKSRWAAIFSGIWLAVIVVAFSGIIGKVAVCSLAGLLIVAALSSLRPREIRALSTIGTTSMISFGVTFVATLTLPIAQAVGLGVIVSLLLQLNREALDLRIVELHAEGSTLVESPAPTTLPSNATTILDVYGSLFYAGSNTLQSHLPNPESATNAVVILRMRGRGFPPGTFFFVIGAYAEALERHGGKLILTGVDPSLAPRFEDINASSTAGNFEILPAHEMLGASTLDGVALGEAWLLKRRKEPDQP